MLNYLSNDNIEYELTNIILKIYFIYLNVMYLCKRKIKRYSFKEKQTIM